MARKRSGFIYTRQQGGEVRYYGDFRDFADVGGKREALIPRGAERATTDLVLAQSLAASRLADLEARRRSRQRGEPEGETFLAPYVVYHLRKKRLAKRVTPQWLDAAELHLRAAIEFFCNRGRPLPQDSSGEVLLSSISDRELRSISVIDIQDYTEWLAKRPANRGAKTLSQSSQRKYLNSLSNLFKRAISEGKVPAGHNPVSGLLEKPQDQHERGESRWLEVHEAALLLESARTYRPKRPYAAIPPEMLHAIIATMLLTGGRPDEVYGLHVRDVSFERGTITFRPNESRARVKTAGSVRAVPMWPQLRAILEEYLREHPIRSGLLFPSPRTGKKVDDIRKALDEIATRVGWRKGEIRPYAFRHTYCAARLQTLDRGHPVSEFTVGRELGHGGAALVRAVYGHLGQHRHRSEEVEFRAEQHMEQLSDRLRALGGIQAA
jgi:integrase